MTTSTPLLEALKSVMTWAITGPFVSAVGHECHTLITDGPDAVAAVVAAVVAAGATVSVAAGATVVDVGIHRVPLETPDAEGRTTRLTGDVPPNLGPPPSPQAFNMDLLRRPDGLRATGDSR